MKKPKKNPKLKVISHKESLYATFDGRSLWSLDKVAFKIMQLCDGKRSVEEIVEIVANKTGLPKDALKKVIQEILEDLTKVNFITWVD